MHEALRNFCGKVVWKILKEDFRKRAGGRKNRDNKVNKQRTKGRALECYCDWFKEFAGSTFSKPGNRFFASP